jgi:hypothetical protein
MPSPRVFNAQEAPDTSAERTRFAGFWSKTLKTASFGVILSPRRIIHIKHIAILGYTRFFVNPRRGFLSGVHNEGAIFTQGGAGRHGRFCPAFTMKGRFLRRAAQGATGGFCSAFTMKGRFLRRAAQGATGGFVRRSLRYGRFKVEGVGLWVPVALHPGLREPLIKSKTNR